MTKGRARGSGKIERRGGQEAPAQHAGARHTQVRPGWHAVEHEALPQPTYWPAVMAFGITLLFWGLVTSYLILVVGLIVLAVALAGWIGDLLHAE